MDIGISVVIPVFNSADSLKLLIPRLMSCLKMLEFEFEILLVDDGSVDSSWETIKNLCKTNKSITGISMMRNYGQHNALLCGIRRARFNLLVTMDDDLQHPPEEISLLVEKINNGYDVVYASPKRERQSVFRNFSSVITKITLGSVVGKRITRKISAFRIFRTRIREAFSNYTSPYVNIDVLLSWGTNRFGYVDVDYQPRSFGKSNYTLLKLFQHAFNMITGYTVLPLQVASFIGFVFTLLGLISFMYVIMTYFFYGSRVAGFPFLASIISIFSGAQLFAIGIIGEYLARMHLRLMDKPSYVICDREGVND